MRTPLSENPSKRGCRLKTPKKYKGASTFNHFKSALQVNKIGSGGTNSIDAENQNVA